MYNVKDTSVNDQNAQRRCGVRLTDTLIRTSSCTVRLLQRAPSFSLSHCLFLRVARVPSLLPSALTEAHNRLYVCALRPTLACSRGQSASRDVRSAVRSSEAFGLSDISGALLISATSALGGVG